MLVARGNSPHSANIHATVPGKVTRMVKWQDNDGQLHEALLIRMEGAFECLGRKTEDHLRESINREELRRLLDDYGIVEMEGSGRPVTDMLAELGTKGNPQTLVVRCVFDDPWLAADYALCKERLAEIVEGSVIIARIGGRIGRIVFAVSHKEKDIGEAMLAEAAQYGIPTSMVLTGSRYPQRNRRELELVLRNFEKKENIELGV
jgi:electron transport complex protein RnfC